MSGPKSTIWTLDPHTKAKHDILRYYLSAWFPILSYRNNRIVYYDGFAGPGRYKNGEEGSPIIALNVARNHSHKLAQEIVFRFVEEDKKRAEHLVNEIRAMGLSEDYKWDVYEGRFDEALKATLDYLDDEGLDIAPTFAFVDPFGITGLPFSLIERLLRRPQVEVFITFMNITLQRFPTVVPDAINKLIGNPEAAKQLTQIKKAEDRAVFARQLYDESLRSCAEYVRYFEMRDKKNRPLYDLFFASNHPTGHIKMKEAMWRLNNDGEYSFSDGANPDQAKLFTSTPERDLAVELFETFEGQTVYSERIIRYTCDETAYLAKHARSALLLLEDGFDGRTIQIEEKKRDGTKRRKHTFPKGTGITFPEGE